MSAPRSRTRPAPPSKAAAKKDKNRPSVVHPEPFDKQAFKIRQLTQNVAQQAELIADQAATIAELTAFIQANAELLELQIVDASQIPPPDSPKDETPAKEEDDT